MKKAGKIVIGLVCVGAFGALMFTRFTKKEEPIEAVPNPTVVVQTPETGNIELSTGLTGTVEPADQVYIIPKGSGEVLEVYVNQGDTVQKGQKLFRIDNKQLDAARITLNTTQVSLNDAQTSVNRMKALYESGDISAHITGKCCDTECTSCLTALGELISINSGCSRGRCTRCM